MTSKKPLPNQAQMYYGAVQKAADADKCFLDLVEGGMNRETLQKCINHRPGLWARYADWLPKLPQAAAEVNP
jgi:hypothetical protein